MLCGMASGEEPESLQIAFSGSTSSCSILRRREWFGFGSAGSSRVAVQTDEGVLSSHLGNHHRISPVFMKGSLASGNTLISCSGRNEKATLRSYPFRASGFEPNSGCSRRRRAGNHLRRVRDPAVRGHPSVFQPLATSGQRDAPGRAERRMPSLRYSIPVCRYTHHLHRRPSTRQGTSCISFALYPCLLATVASTT